jgi:hypothetical protein
MKTGPVSGSPRVDALGDVQILQIGVPPSRASVGTSGGAGRFTCGVSSVLVGFYALECFIGALVCLFGAGYGRHCSAVEGSVALVRSRWGRFVDARLRVGRAVEWGLLLVQDGAAQVVGSLVVVELHLVRVAAVLGETQFGLTTIDRRDRGTVMAIGGGAVGIERYLGFVEVLLVAVGPDLFALGDALVEIDQCLFLVELALLTGLRF